MAALLAPPGCPPSLRSTPPARLLCVHGRREPAGVAAVGPHPAAGHRPRQAGGAAGARARSLPGCGVLAGGAGWAPGAAGQRCAVRLPAACALQHGCLLPPPHLLPLLCCCLRPPQRRCPSAPPPGSPPSSWPAWRACMPSPGRAWPGERSSCLSAARNLARHPVWGPCGPPAPAGLATSRTSAPTNRATLPPRLCPLQDPVPHPHHAAGAAEAVRHASLLRLPPTPARAGRGGRGAGGATEPRAGAAGGRPWRRTRAALCLPCRWLLAVLLLAPLPACWLS